MRPPLKSRVVMATLFAFTVLLFLISPLIKSVLVPIILPVLPAPVLSIALSIVKPIPLPYEMLHDDKPLRDAISPSPRVPLISPVVCDGDGVSGARVQLIYAHAIDVADRYASFASSFQQYAAEIDDILLFSSAETGGVRRLRWVHDSACFPTVLNITLSSTGDDNMMNMTTEMLALGLNRIDRKYLVFMDAHIYCGISDITYDDRPGLENLNNYGPSFGRVDNGCWNAVPAGHELMHTLGAVQLTAPHSSGEFHCWDVDDLMCRPTNGWPTQQLCAFVANRRFDCNHDDYFHTAPSADNYLASYWNSANNQFLIGAPIPVPTPTPCFRGGSGKPCRK